ncbi:hypothetical protein [Streptomyces sp. SM13]|uniref:hypothetical protein n=1 Tax=Streptomyces sp. SM13 TaxID=1983803 RepID=UPI0021564565|nr:hypothetical protein [Streptomyces sp. SM13]
MLLHLVPSTYCLGNEALEQEQRSAAQRGGHDESALVVSQRGHDRMWRAQLSGYVDGRRLVRSLSQRVGVWPLD